jgi:hypothetical protein
MKVKTHVKLAELSLIKHTNALPKGFSKIMFNFGLVMVDQSWLIKTHPHYMQTSLEYITKKIDKLLSIKKFNAYHSMQLGVVVHYLCDFCCNSHISGSIGNIPYHLKYERELQKYLFNNFDTFKNRIHSKSNYLNLTSRNISAIKTSIDNTLRSYIKGTSSYFWDIKHCVQISSLVCSAIFNLNLNLSNNIDHPINQLQLSNLSL